jgi:ribonuclease Z
MAFEVHIIGSGSALPAKGRHHSAQLLKINQSHYLVDCGEGTQFRLVTLGHSLLKITAIFISHLHGDHILGLFGLVSSMDMMGRKKPLFIFSPPGVAELLVSYFRVTNTVLGYELTVKEMDVSEKRLVYEDANVNVFAFPLKHGVSTQGYLFQEKATPRNLIKAKLPPDIKIQEIVKLKAGENVLDENGKIKYSVEDLTHLPPAGKSYAYCSDTEYFENVVAHVQHVDLLFHETTYLEMHKEKAIKNNHSTAKEAAMIARMAHVQKLAIGHLSSRYADFDAHLEEAQKEFANTEAATEGKVFIL